MEKKMIDASVLKTAFLVAEEVAELAGHHIRGSLKLGNIEAEMKGGSPGDLVTAVDRSSQEIIKRYLLGSFPEFAFYGEETVKAGERVNPDVPTWIVDPIDGTTNFDRGIPLFAVSIALMYKGEVLIGVVLELPSFRLFTAKKGEGAWCGKRRLNSSNVSDLSTALIGFDFPNRKERWPNQAIWRTCERLVGEVANQRILGSAVLALCYVADGTLDGYYNCMLFDWDVPAALLILMEAGGVLVDENGKAWQPRAEAHGVVARNRHLHSFTDLYLRKVKLARGLD